MRFYKKALVACARALPALAAVLPSEGSRSDIARPDLLDLDLQDEYAEATFSIPCAGCLGTSHGDESIILNVKTHANDEPCGVSNITLNGSYLPHEWNGDTAHGSAFFSGSTDIQENAWFRQHDIDLEWESACLHGQEDVDDAAQVLTVTIKSIDGKALVTPSGFTLSFKQQSPPELLRLEARPHRSVSVTEHADSWRKPPAHLRLTVPEAARTEISSGSQLEDDIQELRALEWEVQKLQEAIAEKKKHIGSQVKEEAQSLKKELQQCDNFTCLVKTVCKGARGAWKIFHVHLKPDPPLDSGAMGRPESEYQQVWRAGNNKQGHIKIDADDSPPSPAVAAFSATSSTPPPPYSEPLHMPSPDSPFVVGLEIVLGVLCCGCVFAAIRHRCSSLRTRTERAASREERANEQAFRRAARRHAWRKWWGGNRRDQARIIDYEEKRSLIQHQESILEDAMQEEIRQLRAAHGVVNDIVSQAEEGRVYPHNYYNYDRSIPPTPYSPISTASTYPPTSLPELPSRPLSRTDSLPGYRSDASSGPPSYTEDDDTSERVADGFQHHYSSRVSTTSSQWTPDSSIVDVSPRPSADTLRYLEAASEYAETTHTGVGDNDK